MLQNCNLFTQMRRANCRAAIVLKNIISKEFEIPINLVKYLLGNLENKKACETNGKTRDYILDTILSNFCDGATVIISTHLISDIERILDEVIFIDKGQIILASSADELRNKEKSSIDEIFRRYFKC